MDNAQPKTIGRFRVSATLGQGAQGAVYLAEDPQLGRQVAIKPLVGEGMTRPDQHEALMREARIVGRFKHPNIVPVFEVGDLDRGMYVVFEYVEGENLASLLKRGALPTDRALAVMREVLEGVAAAHAQEILHRDIKPANVLIGQDGRVRLTDFGIAMPVTAVTDVNRMWGSLRYMAPEQVRGEPVTKRSDVFALGVLFHEVLTGQRAFDGGSAEAVQYQIVNIDLRAPSLVTGSGDERFDQLILRATSKNPAERFADAGAFREAFLALLDVAIEREGGAGALDFLMRRIKRKPDFPGISRVIQEISHLAANHSERSVSELANAVLKDYATTQKLLRLSNSSFYGQFGGEIHTISRAIVILGFEQVRSAALGLILFENLKNAKESGRLMAALVEALYSGMLARTIARGRKGVEPEQAFICALFHTLGRMLVLYYFPEEAADIQLMVQQRGLREESAAVEVLGVSYERLGKAVLEEWNFPVDIVRTVEPLKGDEPLAATKDAGVVLHRITALSSALSQAVTRHSGAELGRKVDALHARFEKTLDLKREAMDGLVQDSKKQLDAYLGVVKLPREARDHLLQLERHLGTEGEAEAVVAGLLDDTAAAVEQQTAGAAVCVPSPESQVKALMEGMTDLTQSLLGSFNLNELLQSVLETLYRGLGLNRVLLMLPDAGRQTLVPRFGLGADVDGLVGKLRLEVHPKQDVLGLALGTQKDIVVSDSHDAKIAKYIPDAFRRALDAQSFALLPLSVRGRAVGLFYLELHQGAELGEDVLKVLKTLRNQAALAIQQSRG